jgi:DNA-binding transcriptional ArsR family regulator
MPAAHPDFVPEPYLAISDPRQLKAFTDPLRNRMLNVLCHRAATNQQLATTLDEPPAKVLHHLRFLEEIGLVVLVEQRIRGGNVEKYYRATAELYGFQPEGLDVAEYAAPVSLAMLESVRQEYTASFARWPEQELYWEGRHGRLSPGRAAAFNNEVLALLRRYWNEEDPAADAVPMAMAFAMYRFPEPDEG